MLVKDIMKRPFVVEKDISIEQAAKIMSEKKIGSLILASKDSVEGILTESDLTRDFNKHEKVSEAMTTKVITIRSDDSLDRAIELMRTNKVKRLPVVDEDKLVGIITLSDLAEHFEDIEEDFFFE